MDFEAKDFWFLSSHVGIHSGSLEFQISNTSDGCQSQCFICSSIFPQLAYDVSLWFIYCLSRGISHHCPPKSIF